MGYQAREAHAPQPSFLPVFGSLRRKDTDTDATVELGGSDGQQTEGAVCLYGGEVWACFF